MNCIPENLIKQFFITSFFGIDKGKSGDTSYAIKQAIRCAYRDMCRTIRYGGMDDARIGLLYADGSQSIHFGLVKMMFSNSQNKFDKEHQRTCEHLIELFDHYDVKLYYGQAQKWINMTFKYLHILELSDLDLGTSFPYLHVPLDSIVLKTADHQFKLGIKDFTWSRYDYMTYITIQKKIKEGLKGQNPLIWEFKSWNTKKSETSSNN